MKFEIFKNSLRKNSRLDDETIEYMYDSIKPNFSIKENMKDKLMNSIVNSFNYLNYCGEIEMNIFYECKFYHEIILEYCNSENKNIYSYLFINGDNDIIPISEYIELLKLQYFN
jgi:hypothetical protein